MGEIVKATTTLFSYNKFEIAAEHLFEFLKRILKLQLQSSGMFCKLQRGAEKC